MSIFPTKILLATDGSEEAALATRTAVDIAEKTGSELHVVYAEHIPVFVYSAYSPSEVMATGEPINEDVRKRAQRFLDDQVEQIRADGGSVAQAHLRLGRPDEEIVTLADEIGAGLVVTGSRGLGGIRRALMGSVSDGVVRHAHCPVLVVRGEEMAEEKRSFWERLFSSTHRSWREERVLEYIIHRVGEGVPFRDVVQEEYVRRHASPDEVRDILDNPRLVEAARKKMQEDVPGRLDPIIEAARRKKMDEDSSSGKLGHD